jgi:hypothetical protein
MNDRPTGAQQRTIDFLTRTHPGATPNVTIHENPHYAAEGMRVVTFDDAAHRFVIDAEGYTLPALGGPYND